MSYGHSRDVPDYGDTDGIYATTGYYPPDRSIVFPVPTVPFAPILPRKIKCPACGSKVSDDEETCPRCGYPLGEEEEEKQPEVFGDNVRWHEESPKKWWQFWRR